MPLADPRLPARLLAGGGPACPHASVLNALTTPVIGQFDPAFTTIMDEVMDAARAVFETNNPRCFAVSGTAEAGLEALLNSLIVPGDEVVVAGGPAFVAIAADVARRYGATVVGFDGLNARSRYVVAPLIDPDSRVRMPIEALATEAHAHGARLIVDATLGLCASAFGVDDLRVDACCAGAEYALGAPSGMTLVTYTAELEKSMRVPRTSYLDLLQLQAYWSPERLNHHTAPTSLIYGLREALRLVLDDGLEATIARHQQVGAALQVGLRDLGLDVSGDQPYAIVNLPSHLDEAAARNALRDDYDISIASAGPHRWRIALLGPDATLSNARRVTLALQSVIG
jgi:aspartate aminotransferase-like enzyme